MKKIAAQHKAALETAMWQSSEENVATLPAVSPKALAAQLATPLPIWLRPLESMLLSALPERVRLLPEGVKELLGYSIHPPFIRYSDGLHPQRALS